MTGPRAVLVGPMGAGKTTVAGLLAEAWGVAARDTDADVEAAEGRSISDIFVDDGEAHFRALERAAVATALATHDGVLALGGGAVLDPRTQADLHERRVALITVSAEAVGERLQGEKRPLLASGGVAAWKALVEQRRPLYEALARRSFDSSLRPMDAVADDVVAWLREEGL